MLGLGKRGIQEAPLEAPTLDDEAGEMLYYAGAVDEETGETWQVYGDG